MRFVTVAVKRRHAHCERLWKRDSRNASWELHPQKTKIVYCKDDNRTGSHPVQQFDFLGYTFRPRRSMNRHGGVCSSVLLQQSATVQPRRCGIPCALGRLHMHTDLSLADLARRIRPTLVGWIGYYGRFYRSALRRALRPLDQYLVRWGTPKIQTSPNSHHACLGLVARGSVPAALSVRALVSGT